MSIRINSNVSALSAQRRLGQSTSRLQESFTRLSSGLRINRAKDDASGLAIAESLKADSRVFNQGVRNLNDGISFLNIADGALSELSNLAGRLGELSTQAANGTLSSTQRRALNEESLALTNEYNRVINSTTFNGRPVFDTNNLSLSLQAGYSTLTVGLGNEILYASPEGSFQAASIYGGTPQATSLEMGDFNEDGKIDIITGSESSPGGNMLLLANGDGSFRAPVTVNSNNIPQLTAVGDFNGDGHLDFVSSRNNGSPNVTISIGNGNGTFNAAINYVAGAGLGSPVSIVASDMNGDGRADLALTRGTSIAIMLANSNGSFSNPVTYAAAAIVSTPQNMAITDVNGDSKLDMLVSTTTGMSVYLGNGDGSFSAETSYTTAFGTAITTGDVNNDSITDVILGSTTGNRVLLGNGNGTFKAGTGGAGSGAAGIGMTDTNGDGFLDIVATVSATDAVMIFTGNGNGSFRAPVSYVTGDDPRLLRLFDMDGDGVKDIVNVNDAGNSVSVLLANTNDTFNIAPLDLTTRAAALTSMDMARTIQQRINAERGNIGASVSRLTYAVSNLQQGSENFTASASQIMDVDVAEEAANLVRNRILQQAGASILAQANIQPQLALRLLSGD